jgi:anaerobic sulfite reductase subunit C
VGYNKFKEMILKDVKLNPEAMVAQRVLWTETEYRSNFNVKPVTQR